MKNPPLHREAPTITGASILKSNHVIVSKIEKKRKETWNSEVKPLFVPGKEQQQMTTPQVCRTSLACSTTGSAVWVAWVIASSKDPLTSDGLDLSSQNIAKTITSGQIKPVQKKNTTKQAIKPYKQIKAYRTYKTPYSVVWFAMKPDLGFSRSARLSSLRRLCCRLLHCSAGLADVLGGFVLAKCSKIRHKSWTKENQVWTYMKYIFNHIHECKSSKQKSDDSSVHSPFWSRFFGPNRTSVSLAAVLFLPKLLLCLKMVHFLEATYNQVSFKIMLKTFNKYF